MKAVALPLRTRILIDYCRGTLQEPVWLEQQLAEADAYVQTILADRPADGILSLTWSPIPNSHTPDLAAARRDAGKALRYYFEKSGAKCTTPREAATEVLDTLCSEQQRAGFFVGFALALRLADEKGGRQ